MMKRWVLGVPLLLAACSGGGGEDKAADPVALVTLGRVEPGGLADEVTLYGAAEPGPGGRLSLVAPVEATVAAIDAPVGTRLVAGQAVARLAASPTTRVDLAKAVSDDRLSDAALARAIRLRNDGLASNADVETARAAADAADAVRGSLAGRAGRLTLRAPGDAIVETIVPSVGDLVAPGAPVATIARQTDLRARFGIDPSLARSLRLGAPLRILANGGGPPVDARVLAVDPVIDPQTRLSSVFARLSGRIGIGAGQTLTARIAIAAGGQGLSIPYAALLDDGGQAYVFVVAGGVAHRRDIATGPSSGDRIMVTGGVGPGEQVVVAGGTALEDGMKVRTR